MTSAERDAAHLAQRREQTLAALRLTPLERLEWLEQAKAFAQLAMAAQQVALPKTANPVLPAGSEH